ncbi:MAG TPA: UrcA family protein [Steroidobacteraceae bacterium]|nr:UrcA family protein [Steroidobacteraceae bacterium]
MKHLVTTLVGALALYTASGDGLAAEAPAPANVPREIVKFGDLDLTRPAGAQELYRRITHAARDVCETVSSGGSAIAIANGLCIDRAVADAVATIDSPLLTEHYQHTTHREILQRQQVGLNR